MWPNFFSWRCRSRSAAPPRLPSGPSPSLVDGPKPRSHSGAFVGQALSPANPSLSNLRHNILVHLLGWLVAFWAGGAGVTYSHDVAAILYRQCAACHRPNGVAPFSLLTYQETAKRAALISTVTHNRSMPPWLPAEPPFKDDRPLSDAEISILSRWAAQ